MGETQAKYHYLIPQTYMSAWANDAGTLEVEFLSNPGAFEPKNKDNIAGITDYHSIFIGRVPRPQELLHRMGVGECP